MRINECSCGCGGSSDSCNMNDKKELNYMFFGNLESIKRMIDEMVQMDAHEVDEILKDGHEWAVDHIASSLDDVQEVYSFIKNRVSVPLKRERDAFSEDEIFVKTFESYVNDFSRMINEDNEARKTMKDISDDFLEDVFRKISRIIISSQFSEVEDILGKTVNNTGSNLGEVLERIYREAISRRKTR